MHFSHPSVVLDDVSFIWPDGTPALTGITAAFGPGRTGLVGANGTGKTTLLRLIHGELRPTSGTIAVSGRVGRLPQILTLRTRATVVDLLGVGATVEALHAIEAGDPSPRHFEAIGDDWDVEAKARACLDAIGLTSIELDRRVGTLSGGETLLVALAGLQLSGDQVVLLDEPTNNLDRPARHRLYDALQVWPGALIVVSHDVTLLDLMDDTAELHAGALTVFGGGFTDFQEYLAREQAAAEQALRNAHQKLKTEQRQRIEAETKLARRQRYARTDFENKRKPRMVMNQRKTEAQVSAGKLRGEHDEKIAAARRDVDEQHQRIRRDNRIRIDLPDPGVHASRRLAEFWDEHGTTVTVQGPERLALIGRNGAGKTRLMEKLIHPARATVGPLTAIAHTDRIGYLPQRLDHLDDNLSIIDSVRAHAPNTEPETLRANLARFLFRGDSITRPVATLSGGERFRVALAALLLAEPPNQLVVLDEPTNNLDLASIDQLVSALDNYRGGLIVVSHDDAFLRRLRIDVQVELEDETLQVIDA
ncbi:ABC-F family ATP-binding cassette domain-containing protein [Enemella sp. A6]|uniref:ABC-F family ATP-binding cassette domain-containing protein n=1 Tax=Enemella sp. A6 TaxID=3440152 RepID=UPI003EBE00DF